MKNNTSNNKFRWSYLIGFSIILALPILVIPPYFAPADWGKTIVFRSIMAILLFLFLWQILYKKNEFSLPKIKNNKIIWVLDALFVVFLLASIFSVDPLFSFWGSPYRGGGFVTFAFYFVFTILAFILLKKNDWKKAWDFSIIIGILVSLVAVIQFYGLFDRIFLPYSGRPPSTMGNPIILGIYLLLLFFITLLFAIKEPVGTARDKIKKIFYIISLAIFLFTILITGSRAAYLGLAIGALYFFLLYPIKSRETGSPSAKFNGTSLKKIRAIKIALVGLLILVAGFVFYINTVNQYPEFLQQNKLFNSITPRLLARTLLSDSRFYAWTGIDYKILIERPILGYGPENFAVGFDKNYDPLVPNIKSEGVWWDRAHNIIIQIASDAGILGIISYLALFIILFWQLHKVKRAENSDGVKNTLMAHAIQATLIGYLIASLFSFNSFGTYIIFFLIIAYVMHLTSQSATQVETQELHNNTKSWWRPAVIFVLLIALVIFLWQYNLSPFLINAQINKAGSLADQAQCDQAFSIMDKILPEHSFLDSYARMEYVEFTKTCNEYFPENNLVYIKKGAELIKEAIKIQPLYTRYWIYLGNAATALAKQEGPGGYPADAKNNLLLQARDYFNRASQLAPKHQEILTGQAKMEIVAGDYKSAESFSEQCIVLNPDLGDCYWYLGLSEIYLKDNAEAQKNLLLASDKEYVVNSKASLGELSDAYGSISDYQDLIPVYVKLIAINPSVAQYHSSLAFFYKEVGEYDKARQEALRVLELSPESKQNVDDFLKTLPY